MRFESYASGIPFPEGPVFDSHGNLFVCARRDGTIVRVTPDRQVHRFVDTGGKPNGLAIDGNDRLVVADAVRKEILTVDPDGTIGILVPTRFHKTTLVGPNDLCFGANGTLYFTDPGLSMETHDGAVYCLSPNQSELKCLARGLPFPNGLAITFDEKTLYFVESVKARLYAVDVAHSTARSPRLICEIRDGILPDGLQWLDERRLIAAGHGGGALVVLDVSDSSQCRIDLPIGSKPTNVVIREECVFITDDTAEGVLVAPLAALMNQAGV